MIHPKTPPKTPLPQKKRTLFGTTHHIILGSLLPHLWSPYMLQLLQSPVSAGEVTTFTLLNPHSQWNLIWCVSKWEIPWDTPINYMKLTINHDQPVDVWGFPNFFLLKPLINIGERMQNCRIKVFLLSHSSSLKEEELFFSMGTDQNHCT